LRIYIYPDLPNSPQSKIYSDILTVLRRSVYFTEDASEACLFILSVDTVDRDRIRFIYFLVFVREGRRFSLGH